MQAGSETVQSAVSGVTEAQHATVNEHEHAKHERRDGARSRIAVPGNTHKVHMQGRIHGPKGVGAEKFRLAPSALATFCQFYMY